MPGQPLQAVDAAALQSWCRRSTDALVAACAGIDALNVFPVPDGDTGTNLLATMRAAAEAASAPVGGAVEVARAAAHGSLAGARGSSGVILSRFLQGFAAGLADVGPDGDRDGRAVQAALTAAADAAYGAVAEPVEGTILSVARAAAKAARDADSADLLAVVAAAAAAARGELARTTAQLPALAKAGVVDAGGQGLVVLLEALVDTVRRVESAPEPVVATAPLQQSPGAPRANAFSYEVQYLLDAPAEAMPALGERLRQIGDAVAVVSGDEVHNVHVHVDDIGAAIEAGIEAGRPHRISVTRFADQTRACATSPDVATDADPSAVVRVVALCPAGGLADLFRDAGAVVVEAGPDDASLVDALINAARAAHPTGVVLLPNARDHKATADAAATAARAAGCATTVVPTRSPMQGLAALAVHDSRRRLDDDSVAMSAAAAATRYAEVTRATYDALTSAGPCRAGDVLGLIDDDVAAIGDDVDVVARELLDRLLIGGGELVTIVAGADARPALAAELADYVRATRPAVETVVHHGGQPTYPVLIGVE